MLEKIINFLTEMLIRVISFLFHSKRPMEIGDMRFLHVLQKDGFIYVSGCIYHSSLCIRKQKIKRKGDQLILFANTDIIHASKSPLIRQKIKIDDSFNMLMFGKKENLIWCKKNLSEFFYPSIEAVKRLEILYDLPSEW